MVWWFFFFFSLSLSLFFYQFQLALLVSYLLLNTFQYIYLFFLYKNTCMKNWHMSEMMTRLFFMCSWCIMTMSWNCFVPLVLASSFGFRTCFLPYILCAMGVKMCQEQDLYLLLKVSSHKCPEISNCQIREKFSRSCHGEQKAMHYFYSEELFSSSFMKRFISKFILYNSFLFQ